MDFLKQFLGVDVTPISLAYAAPFSLEELKKYSAKDIIIGAQELMRGVTSAPPVRTLEEAISILTFPEPYDIKEALKDNNIHIVHYILYYGNISGLRSKIEYIENKELKTYLETYVSKYPYNMSILTPMGLDFMKQALGDDLMEELFPSDKAPYISSETFFSIINLIYRMRRENPNYSNRPHYSVIYLRRIPPNFVEKYSKEFKERVLESYREPSERYLDKVLKSIDDSEPFLPERNELRILFNPWGFTHIQSSKLLSLFVTHPKYLTEDEKAQATEQIEKQISVIKKEII